MRSEFEEIRKQFMEELARAASDAELSVVENKYFSRKSGEISRLMAMLKDLSDDERKNAGREINELKQELELAFAAKKQTFERERMGSIAETEAIDVTQPTPLARGGERGGGSFLGPRGHIHPITQARWEMEDVARSMGFMVEDGPEIDLDYYNFTALNMSATHPARDMHDTFYVEGHPNWLMRTHVSNMQVRLMKKYGVPLRIAYPGRCFRNESTDARHEHTQYQYESLMVDRGITFADMVGVIKAILKGLYGKELALRLRPKYYPFVEPGVNGEVTCLLCEGHGCRVCKQTGWLEIFGAGMMHPFVLREAGVDPNEYGGFAFGMGLSRMVMLKYGIEDVRLLQSGDMRFLEQF